MSTPSLLLNLVARFRVILDEHEAYLKCFNGYGVQVEGWLKEELLHFLIGKDLNFCREEPCGQGRKKVDFCLKVAEMPAIWIEIKHWHIGKQKGKDYYACSYFSDKRNGIYSDLKKLNKTEGDKYLLILATKNPGQRDWDEGLNKFIKNIELMKLKTKIKSCTETSVFPSSYFIVILKLME